MSITFNQQSHCINHRVIKTESNVTVPSNSISLRTKLRKKKKNVVNIDHLHPKVALYQS